MVARVETLTERMIGCALARESVEIVREFALPLQSRALTYRLNVPEAKAGTYSGISARMHMAGLACAETAVMAIGSAARQRTLA